MNQILITNENNYININMHKLKKHLVVFYLFLILSLIIMIYLLYLFFFRINEKNKTDLLKNKYSIITLYSSTTNNILKISNDISIIGLIEIPKINISYPIILNSTKNLLKISVCRFLGPLPNREGNLCIAGHNYKNNSMFSNLHKLNINDSIFITDLNNTRLEYIVSDKFIVNENDTKCTVNSNNIELTLITCVSNNNSLRTIIKAKVKE